MVSYKFFTRIFYFFCLSQRETSHFNELFTGRLYLFFLFQVSFNSELSGGRITVSREGNILCLWFHKNLELHKKWNVE